MSEVGSNLIDRIGTCSICYERFEQQGHKEPRTLPCGHTFCLECVEAVIKRPDPVCPMCRKNLKIDSIDSIPKNFTVIEIISTLSSVSTIVEERTPSPNSESFPPAFDSEDSVSAPSAPPPSVAFSSSTEEEHHTQEDLDGDPEIVPGTRVVILRQKPVNGDDGWVPGMDEFENKSAVVVEIKGRDRQGCKIALLRRDSNVLSDFSFRVRDLRIIGRESGSESLSGDPSIVVGSFVRINKHREVNGNRNWSNEMDKFINKTAVVVSKCGKDSQDCAIAKVAIDGVVLSKYVFRIRDLTLVPSPPLSDSLNGFDSLKIGSIVIINRHRQVEGNDNWIDDMDKYIGRLARVEEFCGNDKKNCRTCKLSVDGEQLRFVFRARDLVPVGDDGTSAALSDSLSGDPRIKVGSRIIVHKHRAIDGNANWASGMDPFVGKEGKILEFTGTDSKGCKMARISVDGNKVSFVFRVRDLEFFDESSSGMYIPCESLSGDSRIKIGSRVIIHKHREIDGASNWASDMNAYVGKEGKVLEFTGTDSKGCRMARLSVNGTRINYVFRVRDLEVVDEAIHGFSSMTDSLSGDSRIKVGSSVIIHKHRPVGGDSNWASGMNPYVGKKAVILEFTGNDSKGCRMARLSVDGNRVSFVFRVRDLEFVNSSSEDSSYFPAESLSGDSRIVIGSKVIIHKHRPVDGNANWASDMNSYIGKEARVLDFTGNDSKGCKMAHVSVDGSRLRFVFRVRDLEYCESSSSGYVPSESLSGDSRIKVGSRVIVHKHRPVDGNSNWASGMESFVGKEGFVLEFTGSDSKGCRMARLCVDGTRANYVFRVRDLEFCDESNIIGSVYVPSGSLSGDSRIKVGSRVIIHKHRAVDGNCNWASGMESFVGKEAVVLEFTGNDSKGCRMARLSVEGTRSNYVFRVRDLEFRGDAHDSGLSESLSGDERIVLGSRVIIHKHRSVSGSTNWISGMDKYVGKVATIKSFPGTDGSGCRVAKVTVDGVAVDYSFRVRDMTLA